ncbi:MAG: polysaccharide biosynthesis tyrosine autokinase [Mycobacteriales bacterium]
MDLRDYVRLLRRRWRLIAVCALVALAAAVAVTLTSTKQYTARAQLFVSAQDSSGGGISTAYTGNLFTQQRVKSYVSVITSMRTASLVQADLRLPETPEQIASKITASAPLDTVLVNVSVSDADPVRARDIANSVGKVFPGLVDQIEQPSAGGASPVRVSLVQPAVTPDTPTSPRPKLNLALGLLVGLAAGVGAAVLRETLDTSIKTPEQAQDLVGAPVLGAIGYDADATRKPLVVVTEPSSVRSEAFRQLRTNLQFVDIEHPLRSVVLTSSVPGEGKSTTTCNLAVTLAQAGLRVVLVEGDLRRPRIADYMGVEGAIGLTSVLLGRSSLDDTLQPWGDGSLQVLASGPLPPNPSELLGSQGMQDLLRELERRADIILIDAPPLLPVTDAAILGTLTSGLVMLVRSNVTRREQLSRAVETVHAVGATLLGSVLNMVPTKGPDAYTYGYGYSYTAAAGAGRLTSKESALGGRREAPGARPASPSTTVLPHLAAEPVPSYPPAPPAHEQPPAVPPAPQPTWEPAPSPFVEPPVQAFPPAPLPEQPQAFPPAPTVTPGWDATPAPWLPEPPAGPTYAPEPWPGQAPAADPWHRGPEH